MQKGAIGSAITFSPFRTEPTELNLKLEKYSQYWQDDSVLESTDSSSRGPRIIPSTHLGAQSSTTPARGSNILFWPQQKPGLAHGTHTCIQAKYLCTLIMIIIIIIIFKEKYSFA